MLTLREKQKAEAPVIHLSDVLFEQPQKTQKSQRVFPIQGDHPKPSHPRSLEVLNPVHGDPERVGGQQSSLKFREKKTVPPAHVVGHQKYRLLRST